MGAIVAERQPDARLFVVAFDFDGTLTTKDSFSAFLAWRAGRLGYAWGLLRLGPDLMAYLLDRDRGRLKAAAIRQFLAGLSRGQMSDAAEAFAYRYFETLMRPDALAAWRAWQAKGARMVICSASPEAVLAPFARRLNADRLIATRLALDPSGRIAGPLAGENCRGAEKVRRLRQEFGETLSLAAAYGDTAGDHEMLAIAEERGYRLFKERPAPP
jgi:phosphatidylglycerophosphatase C